MISNLQAHLFHAVPTAAVGTAVTDFSNEAKTGVLLSKCKIELKKCYKKRKKNLQLVARDVSRLEPSATAAAAATVAPAAVPAVIATTVAIADEGVW